MLPIYDVIQAQQSILKRTGIDQMPVSPTMMDRLEKMFGQPTTPEEAVKWILLDVRKQGDTGLRSWTKKLDGVELQNFRVPTEEIEAALAVLDPALKNALLEVRVPDPGFLRTPAKNIMDRYKVGWDARANAASAGPGRNLCARRYSAFAIYRINVCHPGQGCRSKAGGDSHPA